MKRQMCKEIVAKEGCDVEIAWKMARGSGLNVPAGCNYLYWFINPSVIAKTDNNSYDAVFLAFLCALIL